MTEAEMILRELTQLREQVERRIDQVDAHLASHDSKLDTINALHQKQAGAYGLAVAVIGLAGACGGAVVIAWKWLVARV